MLTSFNRLFSASAITAILIASQFALSSQQQDSGNNQLKIIQIAKHLGNEPANLSQYMNALAELPHESARLLVAELRPVPTKVYYESKKTHRSRHTIACLRALHYLTGTTFTAGTKRQLTDDQRQFLTAQSGEQLGASQLHFFGVWMSRNAEFVAPQDAQLEIIESWKRWIKESGNSFSYTPASRAENCMDDWYWSG